MTLLEIARLGHPVPVTTAEPVRDPAGPGEVEGVFAQVLQREVDHPDGILFLMRMPDLRYLACEEEMEHLLAALERQGEPQ